MILYVILTVYSKGAIRVSNSDDSFHDEIVTLTRHVIKIFSKPTFIRIVKLRVT